MNAAAHILASTSAALFPGGDRIFQRIFTRLNCHGRPPQFHVELYPYANLAHTIRLRDHVARVRLSDLLMDAPLSVVEAAAAILLGQMYRRPVPPEWRDAYRRYATAQSTRHEIAASRRKRARHRDRAVEHAHAGERPAAITRSRSEGRGDGRIEGDRSRVHSAT